jgi:hypothetical protein
MSMAKYEHILLEELGLFHLKVPNSLVVPAQVQVRRRGQMLGRFTLEDVFEGNFHNLPMRPVAALADLNRASSHAYEIDGDAKFTGPLAWLARVRGSLKARGVREVQITSLNGQLHEVDEGELRRRISSSKARKDGPLGSDEVAAVVVAVAMVTDFSIRFEDELGARVAVDAELAEKVKVEAGIAAKAEGAGGLEISHSEPIPFAVRIWKVERAIIGRGVVIGTFRGAIDLLGDKCTIDPDFVEKIGIEDGAVDF